MRQPALVLCRLAAFGAVVGVLGLGLSGCGSNGGRSPGASPQETSPFLPPQQTGTDLGPAQWPTEGSSPTRLSGNGRYFGYVKAATSDPPTISFDLAQFFYGKSVQRAAEEDGVVSPGESVANDHYERNRVEEARLLRLADDVQVSAGPPASILMWHVSPDVRKKCRVYPGAVPCTVSRTAFFAAAKKIDNGYGIPVWVTIRDGLVVRIDEQYFP